MQPLGPNAPRCTTFQYRHSHIPTPHASQILTTVSSTVDVPFPEPARSFFSILDLSGLNPLELFAGECVNEGLGSYDTRVVVSTLGFGGLCAVNW